MQCNLSLSRNALRLNRRYGTARVGWSLFGAFALLALLHLIESTQAGNAGSEAALKVNAIYVLISFLLLIGMLHLEGMLKERLRVEKLEQQMRAKLEAEVKLKTAYLTRAIEELMQQMEETKRMTAIIDSSRMKEDSTTTLFDRLDARRRRNRKRKKRGPAPWLRMPG